MELVRHTIEYIKRKPYGNNLLTKVKDEVKLVIEATPDYETYDRQKIIDVNAKKGYYLYPEAEGTDDLRLWMNKGSTYEENVKPRYDVSITKHGLKIPADAENYESFVTRMKYSECEFKETFAV